SSGFGGSALPGWLLSRKRRTVGCSASFMMVPPVVVYANIAQEKSVPQHGERQQASRRCPVHQHEGQLASPGGVPGPAVRLGTRGRRWLRVGRPLHPEQQHVQGRQVAEGQERG